MRRLRITRREVADDRRGAADSAWRDVRTAVQRAGGRAWRFRSSTRPGQLVEFIEWSGTDPVSSDEAASALARLDRVAAGSAEVWEEAPVADAD